MFLRIHAGRDQRQQVSAVTGGSHATPMSLSYHPGVDVPAPERPRFDVLRPEGLGQVHRAPDVIGIRLGFDPAALLFIERPVTVELKSTVADPRAWQRSGGDGIRISRQR